MHIDTECESIIIGGDAMNGLMCLCLVNGKKGKTATFYMDSGGVAGSTVRLYKINII